jgi:transcriptional regulator with XRE-family HTH domain
MTKTAAAATKQVVKKVKATKKQAQNALLPLKFSVLRTRLGTALQKHRLRRGLTQDALGEYADLSLKYVGEIERGEANFTIDTFERPAEAVAWNPMDEFEGLREPLSEGVRLLLIDEVEQFLDRGRSMKRWLQALDPALHPRPRATAPERKARAERRPRPSHSSRTKPSD